MTEIEKLEKKSSEDSFWSNREKAQNTLKTLSELKDTVTSFEKLNGEVTDYLDLLEIARIEEDEKSFLEIDKEIPRIENEITAVELDIMLDGEDDDKNAIMTIHPGAGGTESQD